MKTSYNGQLGKGVVWALQQYNDLTITDISKLIGWRYMSVKAELRRLTHNTLLGHYITKEKREHRTIFNMDNELRSSSVEFLTDIAKRTFQFNTPIVKRHDIL
jgi:hypothetical protein